ncbi:MAG TPA: LamG-like jellyroll fold domain-containing protein, partial [Verrucomicrobiae bacterium]|nr:LamG-like jellyroll fold domain-containing protein [Verrucomicrobiae bacterium]
MKTFSLVSLLLISLSLTFNLHAAVTVIHDWHMGESDPDAVSGGYATNTIDSAGGVTLTNQPASGGRYPFYTNNISGSAAFFAGSDLCIFYSGGQYAAGNVIPNLTTNFGMELWVYPTNGTGGQVIAYDGNTGSSGWGIYQSGANCAIFFGGILISTSVPLALNTWTEVALVCTNHVVGLNTTNVVTLYTNGVPALTITNTPVTPAGNFLVAADNSGLETFSGAVDEVRVFTFGEGQFSTTNLLVNQPLVVTTTADSGQGSLRGAAAATTVGNNTITFTNTLSGQAITLANALPVNTSLTIDASALPGGIQINGNGAVTVFNIASGATDVLNSLTITNGYTSSAGGGILNQGTLTLNQCTLSGNSSADNGGGINNGGRLTLNQCTLSGNSSQEGGGIFNDAFSTVTLNTCTLSGNNASADGGGIVNFTDGSAEMTNTIIAGNNGSSGADLYCSGTNTYGGVNLVQFTYNNGTVSGP